MLVGTDEHSQTKVCHFFQNFTKKTFKKKISVLESERGTGVGKHLELCETIS